MSEISPIPEQTGDRQAARLKVPPHSLEAETSVLGGLMLSNDRWFDVAEVVQPGDFYRTQHQIIFEAMSSLAEDDQPLDAVTVSERLQSKALLERAGGLAYLGELVDSTPGASNVVAYARIVREHSTLRQLIAAANRIAEMAFLPEGKESGDLLDVAEQEVFKISEGRLREGGPEGVNSLLTKAVQKVEELFATKARVTGLPTGYHDLDEKTAGLQKADLVIVAGRPSMGKTSLAMNIAEHVVMEANAGVLVFSMEMPAEQLVMRMLSSLSRIDFSRLRTGNLKDEDWARFTSAVAQLKGKDLFIDDTPALTPNELRSRARRVARQSPNGVGLIVVDYLQLMRTAGDAESRTNEISEISRSLKAIAKELSCPLIALSQLNRSLENRTDKRPVMADLRECVPGDTLVNISDGRRVPIRDLEGQQPEVLAVNCQQKIVAAQADAVWKVGRRKTLKLTLASGRAVRATPKHRFLTGKGWMRLGKIAVGDRVAIARQLRTSGHMDGWSERRLGLLAHMIGDGSYLSGQPLRYTTGCELHSQFVADAARTEFGVRVNRHEGRGNWHQLVFSGNGNRWHPAGLNLWLRELGVFNQRSAEKRVPKDVFLHSDDDVAVFLKHLWATDGCYHSRTGRGSDSLYFSTCGEGLAKDVAALLLRFGIVARITHTRQQKSIVYGVHVSGSEQQTRFIERIGAFGEKVADAEKLLRKLKNRSTDTNVDTLPREIFGRVKDRMSQLGVSQREMAKRRGTAYGGAAHFKFAPSRGVVAEYASLLDDPSLKESAESDLFWDKVVGVDAEGFEDVYDLTVPGPANWLADGIVSHNSGAIEQDADLILFIYRDEVYNDTSPDKGVAEVIISKQRNGPIGTVRLSFLGALTKFENLASDVYNDFN